MFPTNIKSGLKSALLLGVSSAAVGLSIPAAYADTVETVVVTGSRIPNRDFTSDSPISTISAESLKATGVVEVTALLNTLPQVVPAFSSGSNNPPSGGLQAVDLRGLGPNRNIVLIDGRRAAPATIGGVVDIQTIPQSLIDRVEVITGGASAVYGPDAITGVVNFILKDNFEGAAADAQYGISDRGDNITESASMTIGGNFADGKGNAVITFDWAKRNPVTDAERDFANQATSLTSYFPDGVYRPSGNKPAQASIDAYFAAHGGALPGHISNAQNLVVNPDGTLFNSGGVGIDGGTPATDFSGTSSGVFNFNSDPTFPARLFCADPSDPSNCQTYSYNFQPPNLLIVPLNRRNFMGQAHYDINEYVTAYGSAHFTSYHSASSLAPSPAPTSGVTSPTGENCGTAYCVPVDRGPQVFNPYIPTDLRNLLLSRINKSGDPINGGDNVNLISEGPTEDFLIRTRFLQLGPRLQDNGINTYQVTGGFKGNLPWLNNSFHYDVFASYGNSDTLTLQFGNVSNSAVEKALYGKATDDTACVAYDATLAPQFRGYCGYNPFGHDKMSAEAANYVARIAKNSVNTTFTDIEATFGGDIMQLPAGAMAFSLGADYREQTYNFIPDPLLASGDISGFNSASPVQGAVYDREVFGELYVPILKDHAWADSLSITLGGRYTNQANTTDGSPYTWKAEGDWTVLHTLTFRGSYQVATRVPNIGELFATTLQNNPVLADPCNADGPFRKKANGDPADHAAEVLALCQAQAARFSGDLTSFNDNYVQGTTQILAKSGGTLSLRPETADTVTLGVAFQSDSENPWFSNFKASVDYWNIDLHAPIGVDFFDIMYGCFNADGSNPTYDPLAASCVDQTPAHNPRIVRSSSGSIYYLNAFSGNLAKNQLDGVDVAIQWGLDLADTVGADPKWGNLGFNFAGTWLHEFNVQGTQAGAVLDYAGTIGATSPIGLTTDAALPKWKATLTTTWNFLDDFSLTSRINYISAMKNSLDKVGWTGFPLSPSFVTGVPSTWYFDVSGGWNVTDHLSVRAGVQNLFDQQPRLYNPSQQDGTDPTTYDIVGRSYFMGVSVKY